ncbi:MAG: tRNA (adenosine(37)-N6)-threonylcarbamoyltransferase complex ATPase subunit type 1 TsaE [Lysobacteraceae bacterium]
MTDHRRIELPDPAATDALGAALAAALPAGRLVVHLLGDLGAGKSSLARALLRALGAQGALRSPTYTLVERHRLREGEAAHLDLYRITDPEELDYLALDELADAVRLWLVEWPQRGGERLPPADLRIVLSLAGDGREAGLSAPSAAGRTWLDALSEPSTDAAPGAH